MITKKLENIAKLLKSVRYRIDEVDTAGRGKGWQEAEKYFSEELYRCLTLDGERTNYSYAFARTNFDNVPIYFENPITPTGAIDRMFYYYYGQYLPNVDLSQVAPNKDCQALFYGSKLRTIPDLGLPAMNGYLNVYANCAELVTIGKLRVKQSTEFPSTFSGCSKLQVINFEGTIGQNINLSSSPKLTATTMVNMFNKLYNYKGSGTTHTVTLGSTNLAKLSSSNKAIATQKGWTLA